VTADTKLSRRTHTRRSILQGAVAGAMLLGTARFTLASAVDRKFKITLSPGMLGIRANMHECIELASKFGFEGVEPIVSDLAKLTPDELAQMQADLKARNLVLGCTMPAMPFSGPEGSYRSFVKKLPETAAILQKAGGTRIGTWLLPSDEKLTYLENFHRHTARIKEVAKILDDHAIRFGLEYLGPRTMRARAKFPFVHCMKEMRELLAETGATNVGIVLDSWHWFNAQDTTADIRALKNEDIVYVHLNDAPAGVPLDQQVDNHRCLPATTGVIDIGGLLDALIAIGYDGPAAAEPFDDELKKMPREEACQRGIDAIRRALDKA
jgi:sugar phosphate isomerase/epimerase